LCWAARGGGPQRRPVPAAAIAGRRGLATRRGRPDDPSGHSSCPTARPPAPRRSPAARRRDRGAAHDTCTGSRPPLVPDAIERLFAAKRRPPEKAVALLLADAAQADGLGIVGGGPGLGSRFWPGGLTLVLPRRPEAELPEELAAGAPTVGVRVPDHPAPRALAAVLGPLPTTSANLSGRPDARDAAEIAATLGDAIALVIDDGPIHGGPGSTVVDCTTERPRVLRAGAIPPARIAAALDEAGIAHDIETEAARPAEATAPGAAVADVGR